MSYRIFKIQFQNGYLNQFLIDFNKLGVKLKLRRLKIKAKEILKFEQKPFVLISIKGRRLGFGHLILCVGNAPEFQNFEKKQQKTFQNANEKRFFVTEIGQKICHSCQVAHAIFAPHVFNPYMSI